MTTNNHPANGPVSLDRLHQISEILSKAAAQSDGGNIGYAMADAVKVINSTIAEFGAEPVAWTEKCEITNMQATGLYLRGFPDNSHGRDIALYTAPPAPVVPTFDEWLHISGNKPLGWVKDAMRESYDACRAAMLQAGNSPVTPDGSEDTKRLDWLDAQNKRLNEYYGTSYGWKFDANFQRNAMMLNDSNYPVMTVRQAIDEAIAEAPKQENI
ncbi:hypothetical protein [Citrobacter freundii]|uniref:hypothetical protein n=1 Tax=Citrobacter freundii TaxID=546 RepID=UPI0028C15BDD|nr:hypothetical protein [Citrobacter freundii]HBK3067921.1 hypothetical protein [Citrobacter freundii]